MTEQQWKNWTPQYDGHAPDDWDGGECEFKCGQWHYLTQPAWDVAFEYRYRPTQDATTETLTAQCLRPPQADRDALIEALQKKDWAEEVWEKADEAFGNDGKVSAAAVIRSMCRPKEEPKQ